jgi:uracil DNA glycosylase
MLNTVLTVRKADANSHKGQGWETFTDAVIRELNARKKGVVFLLWGKPAEQKCKAVDKSKHFVLTVRVRTWFRMYREFVSTVARAMHAYCLEKLSFFSQFVPKFNRFAISFDVLSHIFEAR